MLLAVLPIVVAVVHFTHILFAAFFHSSFTADFHKSLSILPNIHDQNHQLESHQFEVLSQFSIFALSISEADSRSIVF